jgi:hypothetical protein
MGLFWLATGEALKSANLKKRFLSGLDDMRNKRVKVFLPTALHDDFSVLLAFASFSMHFSSILTNGTASTFVLFYPAWSILHGNVTRIYPKANRQVS